MAPKQKRPRASSAGGAQHGARKRRKLDVQSMALQLTKAMYIEVMRDGQISGDERRILQKIVIILAQLYGGVMDDFKMHLDAEAVDSILGDDDVPRLSEMLGKVGGEIRKELRAPDTSPGRIVGAVLGGLQLVGVDTCELNAKALAECLVDSSGALIFNVPGVEEQSEALIVKAACGRVWNWLVNGLLEAIPEKYMLKQRLVDACTGRMPLAMVPTCIAFFSIAFIYTVLVTTVGLITLFMRLRVVLCCFRRLVVVKHLIFPLLLLSESVFGWNPECPVYGCDAGFLGLGLVTYLVRFPTVLAAWTFRTVAACVFTISLILAKIGWDVWALLRFVVYPLAAGVLLFTVPLERRRKMAAVLAAVLVFDVYALRPLMSGIALLTGGLFWSFFEIGACMAQLYFEILVSLIIANVIDDFMENVEDALQPNLVALSMTMGASRA